MDDELARFDDMVTKKQNKIEKITEHYLQLAVKTSMLGTDANFNEYWFYKDDVAHLFMKNSSGNAGVRWFYLDEEEEFSQLCDSLNSRGIRERRLLEALRKIGPMLKLKKPRQKTATEPDQKGGEQKTEKDISAASEATKPTEVGRHHVFANDNFKTSLRESVWFTKTLPKRRGPSARTALINLDDSINLESIKTKLLKCERLYTDCMRNSEREWDTEEIRKATLLLVDEAQSPADLFAIMQTLEKGFDDPWQLTVKLNEETNEEEIKRSKIQLFKFWPKPMLKTNWKRYVEAVDADGDFTNANAGWIAAAILDKEVEKFTENQVKKQLAKVEKMTGEAIGSAKQQTLALQKIPNGGGGGRDRKQRINYRQYFAESDESESEDKKMKDELGVSGRERRAA